MLVNGAGCTSLETDLLVVGAYPETDDMRDAPALSIVPRLIEDGAALPVVGLG